MSKPIVVFYLKGYPTSEDRDEISHKVLDLIPKEEYHTLIIFGAEQTKLELLTKGRKTATLTKKLSKLLK